MIGSIVPKWNELDRTARLSSTTAIILVCTGSRAGSERNLWRGRIWNRSHVSCPPSSFNPAGREWAEPVVPQIEPDEKVEHHNSSLARGIRPNIHDCWICHPSSIPMLAPPSHRFLSLKETAIRRITESRSQEWNAVEQFRS